MVKKVKKEALEQELLDRLQDALEIPRKVTTLKELLNLDPTHIKGVGFEDAAVLRKVLKVHTINDLAKVNINEEQFLMLKLLGISPSDLNIWLFVSKMLQKGKIEETFGPKKISLVGLDNAGKTAILHVLENKLNIDIFSKLRPTVGVNRGIIEKFGFTYTVLDMGGQERYRTDYIKNPEKYFVKIGLLIFVLDVQDPDRYDEAINYFKEILTILELLKENPEILIMLHKVDPDIKDQLTKSINYLETTINDLLKGKEFQHEIIEYSIFNSLSDNKTVVTNIRDFLNTSSDSYQELKDYVTELVGRMMNIVITLTTSIEARFQNLEGSIKSIREWTSYQKPATLEATPEVPLDETISNEFKKLQNVESMKQSLRNELKSILKLRKME